MVISGCVSNGDLLATGNKSSRKEYEKFKDYSSRRGYIYSGTYEDWAKKQHKK